MINDKLKGKSSKKTKRRYNYQKTNNTLDTCHEKQLDAFNKKYNSITSLEKELKKVRKNIKNETDENVLFDLEQKEKEILSNISKINSKEDEIDYLVNTSEVLFNYYDSVENNDADNNVKNINIIDFFNNNIQNIKSNQDQNRSDLLETYLSYTDKDYINNNLTCEVDICQHCQSKNINEYSHDGILFCNDCNTIEYIITDNEKPGYKEPPKEISYFSYNRINHFNEWIAQSQGKETTDIPEEVFDKIFMELKKNKVTNMATLNYEKIRAILKKNKINKYYEHIPYILNRITGKSTPQLTPELEEKLRQMFKEIQGPFIKHSPKNRKNFLSYSYVLHKFLEILGEDEYIKYFPLLKSREKLYQQELIWEKICEELGWQFIKSI
jgi:hypothetical protein|tara:strand:+ start:1784 stop:2932 length:1149 start_codon:yes stop_codon:yes gene_type:complete